MKRRMHLVAESGFTTLTAILVLGAAQLASWVYALVLKIRGERSA